MPLPPAASSSRPNTLPPDRRAASDIDSGVEVGDYVQVASDPDEPILSEAPDGGAFVDFPGHEQESEPPDSGFYANLAATLPPNVQDRIVTDLLRRIEDDKTSREQRDKQYAEGLRRTGMGKDAPGGAAFEGASLVTHPMMTEACIDYESRIIKELFPPSGPVKPHILGAVTTEKTQRARRIADHMNFQLTTQIKEARAVLETTLTQVPLGGSQFIHQYWDHRLRRPRWEFRSVDKMYIPFVAADFASASRRTYEDTLTAVEFRQRVDQGMYVDVDLPTTGMPAEPSKSETANRKIEGVDDPGTNEDGDRAIYETTTYLDVSAEMAELLGVEAEDDLCPYVITMDVAGKKMLSMYRCWEDGDEAREPIEHDFEFPFLPWRGALSIGFPQVIGGLSGAATGALRALLDSAHANNVPSGLIKKGSSVSGQTRSPNPGELMEVDVGLESDDIRKSVMPFPFNQPSAVLFQLLGFVVDAAKGIVRTSLDETPIQGGTAVPVGTQMSRVEEGLVVFSAIHGRAHAAFNRLLKGLHRLNRLYLPKVLKVDAAGRELLVRRADYEGPCDVQPVSDPTIYSDQQRFAQLNYIQARMMVSPPLWKAREVELAGLKLIKWPDPETLLADAPQPRELNQVNECLAIVMGQPVTVFPEQDHLAHLQVLLDFLKSPVLGASPLLAPGFLPAALKHAAQHIAFHYVQQTVHAVETAAKLPIDELLSNDTSVKAGLDGLLAAASQRVVPAIEGQLAQAMPVLQAAMAQMKAMMPPPPMDPAQAAVQAAAAETQRKGAADQAGHTIDQGKLALEQQANAIAADKVAAAREGQQISAQTKEATTAQDNQTALDISSARVASGESAGFKNGESITR